MIDTRYYQTRKDGVRLFRTVDALTNEQGEVVLNDEGFAVLRGFYMLQNETGILYSGAIDVENAPYTYSETEHPMEDYNQEGGMKDE